jgi:hypothetical protein
MRCSPPDAPSWLSSSRCGEAERLASRVDVDRGGVLLALVIPLALLAGLAVLVPAVVVVSAAADCDVAADEASELAAVEIPADYLMLYQQAGARSDVPWAVLAAIGWVETRHGTLDAPGVRAGSNSAGAAGPMQFGIGGRAGDTWGGAPTRAVPPQLGYGVDGNGDGIADVYNPADAIPAAAAYLLAHGAPDDLRSALLAYNRADWYVDDVLDKAAAYTNGGTVAVAGAVDFCTSIDAPEYRPGGETGTWGGHANGRIPLDQLCPITANGRLLLRCDAAQAFLAMDAAHTAELGRSIVVTDAYRDLAGQVDVHRRKPELAATPGTSTHGWGLAVDMAVGGWNGPTFRWLERNGPRFGWHHPPWAHKDGSKPEAWHWEYAPAATSG